MKNNKTTLVILSAPSGCGKDTVINEVCKRLDGVGVSISCTTRAPRSKKGGTHEQNGVEYFFIDRAEFEEKIRQQGFLEYAEFEGELYGTPLDYLEKLRNAGKDVIILNIENDGAAQVKTVDPTAVSIFILPPSAGEIHRRLVDRSAETADQIEARIAKGAKQMQGVNDYDYCVMNDTLEDAVQDVVHIISAARCRTILHKELIDRVSATFAGQ